jgi:KTSC domain
LAARLRTDVPCPAKKWWEGKMAKLISVESSMIQAVGYDPKTRLLEVVFNSGRAYCYEDVPPKVYKELMAADSKGQYLRSEIMGVYPDHPISGRRRC